MEVDISESIPFEPEGELSDSLPLPNAPRDNQLDDIKTEYHPSSGKPPSYSSFENHKWKQDQPTLDSMTQEDLEESVPWYPWRSRSDFEFAELALKAELKKAHVDAFLSLISRLIQEEDSFSLKTYQDVEKGWLVSKPLQTSVGLLDYI